MQKKLTYKKAGVDINKAEEYLGWVKRAFPNLKNAPAAFAACFNLNKILKEYKSPYLVATADGVGTKLKIAQNLNIHNTVGIDLVAMNVNDIICLGAKPLFFLDYLACASLDYTPFIEIMQGIKKGLSLSDCLLLGGETAQMPGMYKRGEYDLAGFCVGIADEKFILRGNKIRPQDKIVGLASSGLHSNGFSLVRRVFSSSQIKKHKRELLKPTKIYVKEIMHLLNLERFRKHIKGISHITGGGFYQKAIKCLPAGLGMLIEKNTWQVPEIFKIIQKRGNVPEEEMWTVFNMGIGMMLIVSPKAAYQITEELKEKFNTKSSIIGKIVKSKVKMRLI